MTAVSIESGVSTLYIDGPFDSPFEDLGFPRDDRRVQGGRISTGAVLFEPGIHFVGYSEFKYQNWTARTNSREVPNSGISTVFPVDFPSTKSVT